ncbi:MAG: hypothetical protein LUQ54_03805, partial [Methanoregula sp.]|nr:hypothetical protein [Methanoregula sp.]
MKESLRRITLFTVIVTAGLVMILLDVPLILMVPLVLAVGIIILILLGAIRVADIRPASHGKKSKTIKKVSVIQRLNEMKFFEKPVSQPGNPPASPDKKKEIPKNSVKSAVDKPGYVSHLRSFFTSLGSLQSILRERRQQAKKVEDIDVLLDKAISEKVKSSALATASKGVGPAIPLPGNGIGSSTKVPEKDQDPFLSLSGDEFDASLLDGLEDQDAPVSLSEPGTVVTGSTLSMNEPDIPLPSPEISPDTGSVLTNNEGPEEFSGLEGGDSIDHDFSDLDNLNLDDIDLETDLPEETLPAVGGSPVTSDQSTVKADWIASDAPKGADLTGNGIPSGNEMASFAGGKSSSDADMLSSL